MMASEDKAMTLDAETICHDGKLVEKADPSKGNDLAMTTARTAAVTRISIALPAAIMTKGKAPAAMTMIHLHGEQREAIIVVEIDRRMARVKDDVILRHPHQAAPMAVAWRWRTSKITQLSKGSAGPEALRRMYPPKRDCQVSDSLLPQPKVLWTTDP
jgi:hypothetical protein